MADFLTVSSSKKIAHIEPVLKNIESSNFQDAQPIQSTDAVLDALKKHPSRAMVNNVLQYLTNYGSSLAPSDPINASIAHQLVNDTLPNYWRTLKPSPEAKLLAQVLRNPTGLGHMITRLQTLIADNALPKISNEARDTLQHIEDMIDVLDQILRDSNTSRLVLGDVLAFGKNKIQKSLIWKEFLAQTASGRLLSIVAEAEDLLNKRDPAASSSWLADGRKYALWLGRNVTALARHDAANEDFVVATGELFSKALNLGYTGWFSRSRCITC